MTKSSIFNRTVLAAVFCAAATGTAITNFTAHAQVANTGTGTTSPSGPNAAPAVRKTVYSAFLVTAAQQNARLQNSLQWPFGGRMQAGWYLYAPLIAHTIGTDADPGTPEFAGSLAEWQSRNGIAGSGVVDPATLQTFVKHWQSQRLGRSDYPSSDKLLAAPIADFFDQTRDPSLLSLERETYAAYKRMVAAAAKDKSLGLKLTASGELAPEEKFLRIVSAYRSREYQEQLRKREPKAGRAALARHSPHFTGQALDIYVGGEPVTTKDANRAIQVQTPVYKWLVKNAHKFGFYPYFYEPWHWEYVPNK